MENIIIKDLNINNYKAVGLLMSSGFTQDEDGFWSNNIIEDFYINNEDDFVLNGEFVVKFGNIKGEFNCKNIGLTTLKGAPLKCKSFDCSYNNLKVLDFIPISHMYNFTGCNIKK